jgi:cytochrome bd-type quinol oxidase subunit 2
MSEPVGSTLRRTGTGFGRILVFVYGILAFAATGRATFELASKFSEAPVPYALSMVAAVVYVVATWALATDRRRIALAAVSFELVGVLAVGVSSLVWTSKFPDASGWSDFGVGDGRVPLVLPVVRLWWILRGSRHAEG